MDALLFDFSMSQSYFAFRAPNKGSKGKLGIPLGAFILEFYRFFFPSSPRIGQNLAPIKISKKSGKIRPE
jgi:hypothetical protein